MPEVRLCEHNVCDFCSSHLPAWEYPARNADLSLPGLEAPGQHTSIGAWLACEECAQLIEHSAWTRLAERCISAPSSALSAAIESMGRETALGMAAFSVKTFRSARTGGARKRYTDGTEPKPENIH